MKIDKLRWKYRLKVMIKPSAWIRIHKTDEEWDNWLWEQLQDFNNIQCIGEHHAIVSGYVVWISNYPYGSGVPSNSHYNVSERSTGCRRSTAIFLQEQLIKALPFLTLKELTGKKGQKIVYDKHMDHAKGEREQLPMLTKHEPYWT